MPKILGNRNKIKKSARGKFARPLDILPFFFTVFLGKMDQKWAGSKFFGFLWIWVNVLDDPLKEKKMFLQKHGEKDNFPVLPPKTP